jgi:hypothetical protein
MSARNPADFIAGRIALVTGAGQRSSHGGLTARAASIDQPKCSRSHLVETFEGWDSCCGDGTFGRSSRLPNTMASLASARQGLHNHECERAHQTEVSRLSVRSALTCLARGGAWRSLRSHPQPCAVDLFKLFWRELTLVGRSSLPARRLPPSGQLPASAISDHVGGVVLPANGRMARPMTVHRDPPDPTRLDGGSPPAAFCRSRKYSGCRSTRSMPHSRPAAWDPTAIDDPTSASQSV